jgi:hypothetical protein
MDELSAVKERLRQVEHQMQMVLRDIALQHVPAPEEPGPHCAKCDTEIVCCDVCDSECCYACDLVECGNCGLSVCRKHLTVCPWCEKTEMCQDGCLESRFERCCQPCSERLIGRIKKNLQVNV